MPVRSGFLSLLRPEKFEIREIGENGLPDRIANSAEPAKAVTSDAADSKPGALLSAGSATAGSATTSRQDCFKAKNDELYDLLDEVHQLYDVDRYGDDVPDDLSPRRPSWPAITIHEGRTRDLSTPAPLRSASSTLAKQHHDVHTASSGKAGTSLTVAKKKSYRADWVSPVPLEDPDTPPPLRITPRSRIHRKPVPLSPHKNPIDTSDLRINGASDGHGNLDSSYHLRVPPPAIETSLDDLLIQYGALVMAKRASERGSQKEETNSRKLHRSSKKKDFFADESLLLSSKSKLVKEDLHRYFQREEAWDVLSEKEKEAIRDIFPPDAPFDENGRPTAQFLNHNNDSRNGIRPLQDDLSEGLHDPQWVHDAKVTSEERAARQCDDWKVQKFEEFGGQKLNLDPAALLCNAARVKLEEMVLGNVFRVGDFWSYSRAFRRGRRGILVEKDVKVTNVCSDGKLLFSIPSGRVKFFHPGKPIPPIPNKSAGRSREVQGKLESPQYSSSGSYSDMASQHYPLTMQPMTKSIFTGQIPENPSEDFGRRITFKDDTSSESPASSPLSPPGMSPSSPSSFAELQRHDAIRVRRHVPAVESPRTPTHTRGYMLRSAFANGSPGFRKRTPLSPTSTKSDDGTPITCTVGVPQDLERRILELDGRVKLDNLDSSGLVWKAIRCRRGEKDIGSLADVRDRFYTEGLK